MPGLHSAFWALSSLFRRILSGREFVGQIIFGVCILDIILGGCECSILVGIERGLLQGLE